MQPFTSGSFLRKYPARRPGPSLRPGYLGSSAGPLRPPGPGDTVVRNGVTSVDPYQLRRPVGPVRHALGNQQRRRPERVAHSQPHTQAHGRFGLLAGDDIGEHLLEHQPSAVKAAGGKAAGMVYVACAAPRADGRRILAASTSRSLMTPRTCLPSTTGR